MLLRTADRIKRIIGSANEKNDAERSEDQTQKDPLSDVRLIRAHSWIPQSRISTEAGKNRKAIMTAMRLNKAGINRSSRAQSPTTLSTFCVHALNPVSKPHSLSRPDSLPHMNILYLDPEEAPPLVGDAIIWNKIFDAIPSDDSSPTSDQKIPKLSINTSEPILNIHRELESPTNDEDMTPTQRLPAIENSEVDDWLRSMDQLFLKASIPFESHKEVSIRPSRSNQDFRAGYGIDADGNAEHRLSFQDEACPATIRESDVTEQRKLSLEQTPLEPKDGVLSTVRTRTPSMNPDLLKLPAISIEDSTRGSQMKPVKGNEHKHKETVKNGQFGNATVMDDSRKLSSETIRSIPKSREILSVSSNKYRTSPPLCYNVKNSRSRHQNVPHLAYLISSSHASGSNGHQNTPKIVERPVEAAKSECETTNTLCLQYDDLVFPTPPRLSQHLSPKSRNRPLPIIPQKLSMSKLSTGPAVIDTTGHRPKPTVRAAHQAINFTEGFLSAGTLESTAYSLTCPLFKHGRIRLRESLRRPMSQRHQISFYFDGDDKEKSTERDEPLDWTAFQMAISGGAGDFQVERDSIINDEGVITDELEEEIDDILEWWKDFGFSEDMESVEKPAKIERPRNDHYTVNKKGGKRNPDKSIAKAKVRSNPRKSSELWLSGDIYELEAIAVGNPFRGTRRARYDLDHDSDRSLPDSPMEDIDPDALQRKGSVVLMGFNLGHDLGDFLRWEAEYVESMV